MGGESHPRPKGSVGERSPESNSLEWQTDALAAAAANAQLEGDDNASADSATATTRLSNTCQISRKIPRVTGTQEVVQKAGRRSEMSYQVAKRSQELLRDMETVLLANQQEETGGATTARTLGAVPSWITTNTSNGATGSDGSLGNTVRTDGTQRAFTESLLKVVLQAAWEAGGNPDCIMVGAFNKRVLSTFTGNATRYLDADSNTLSTAIDFYQSDWGQLSVVPNRFMRSRDCLVLQKDMWAVAYLRPFALHDLAKTGDTERKELIVEYTLESRNEAASAAVWDLTTS